MGRPASATTKPKAGLHGRTLYADYRAMRVCFHEAGHAVVGHVLGRTPTHVEAGQGVDMTYFESHTPDALYAEVKAVISRHLREMRIEVVVDAAGPVAGNIHQAEVQARGFTCGAESRAYSRYWEFRVSDRFGLVPDDDPFSDYMRVVRFARSISQGRVICGFPARVLNESDWSVVKEAIDALTPDHTKAEILKVEETAEKILKRHWVAVTDTALALHKAKSGRLTRRQLVARLERHGVLTTMT